MYTLTHDPVVLAVAITPVLAVATALIVGAALWIRSMVLRRKAGPTAPDWRDRMIEAWPPQSAPTVARAALTPDCPSLDSEFWRANPTEPLSPREVVRWKDITEKYEWVAVSVVVPGRSEP